MFGMFDESGEKIERLMKNNVDMYKDLGTPALYDVDFNPELAQYSLLAEDPFLLQKQMGAIETLKRSADEGLSAQDLYAMDKANRAAGDRARRARQAALQNAQARGVSGGGLEFALGEIANQESAERARSQAMEQNMASAKQRAMNQMAYTQNLGNVRDQNYRTKAQNTGVINQFNTMNTGTRNQANLRNIDQRRDNEQQRYQNQLARLDGIAGGRKGMADAAAAQGAANAQGMNSMMGLIGSLGGAAILASDENLKHKVRGADEAIKETLDELKPYYWEYKNPTFGTGEYVGVMAQDLEKTPVGKLVVFDTPEGKMINTQKLVPMMMAALASQQKRINELEAKLG